MSAALDVTGLTVGYRNADGEPTVVVRDLGLQLHAGRVLGLAGESGCGKSTAALAAIGFPIPGSVRLAGSSVFDGQDLLQLPIAALRRIWGRRISYVAQDASLALNPLHRVERLLGEPIRLHLGLGETETEARALDLLGRVGIADPAVALRRYPHQFSGGQQQRIALAIATACEPAVLVLDEPTTGLDVTTQAQISKLIVDLVRDTQTAAVAISHDLALLATICDEIAIMYAGEIVEQAAARTVYGAARHPYAAALLDAVPRVDESSPTVGIPGLPPAEVVSDHCAFADRCRFAEDRCRSEYPQLLEVGPSHTVRCLRADVLGVIASARPPGRAGGRRVGEDRLLEVEGLVCRYRGSRAPAVDGVTITVAPGETVAVVGESGSGKSTLLRAIAGLHAPERGAISFHGDALPAHAVSRSRTVRQAIQLVFQNPHASLNPRHTIAAIVERPLTLFRPDLDRQARRDRVAELLAEVRLDRALLGRYPAQLSGGQKQRVALARAFAAEPELILCDEVVSALDVSVQASILDLLATLARERSTALVFVTHDLAVVRSIADRVYVMRHGVVREQGATEGLFTTPQDGYTRELLAAVPRPERSAAGVAAGSGTDEGG